MEDWFQFREGIEGAIGARAFIALEDGLLRSGGRGGFDFHGHNFLVEFALLLRRDGVLMAAQSERVGVFARDRVFALHALGGQSHAHVDFGPMIDEPGIGRGFEAAERGLAHGFGAAGDQDIGAAAAYAVGRQRDGLQTGTAEAVDGHAGNGFGQTGAQQGLARHIVAGFALGHGAADNDVFDAICGLGVAREQGADDGGGEIVGPRVAKSAARGLADGGAETIDNDGFWHVLTNCMRGRQAIGGAIRRAAKRLTYNLQ